MRRGRGGNKSGKADSARDSETNEGIGRRDSVGMPGGESGRAHTLEVSDGGQIGGSSDDGCGGQSANTVSVAGAERSRTGAVTGRRRPALGT
mmetsp:Transcript_67647/g.101966  ORF Transcript_67647/g.101966 Transcript_67647/m.101966 type:complete len:92 (+) Transcript_67647:3-278(+)